MSLIVGITSGFWIWSSKTVEAWKRVFRRRGTKSSRCNAIAVTRKAPGNFAPTNIQYPSQFSFKSVQDQIGGLGKIHAMDDEQRTAPFCPVVRASSSGIGGSSGTGSGYANTTPVVDQNSADVNRTFAFNSGDFTTPLPHRLGMY